MLWIELDQTFQRLSHSRTCVTTFTIDTRRFCCTYSSVRSLLAISTWWSDPANIADGNRYFQILRECDRGIFRDRPRRTCLSSPIPLSCDATVKFKDPRRNFCCDTGLGVFYDWTRTARILNSLTFFFTKVLIRKFQTKKNQAFVFP